MHTQRQCAAPAVLLLFLLCSSCCHSAVPARLPSLRKDSSISIDQLPGLHPDVLQAVRGSQGDAVGSPTRRIISPLSISTRPGLLDVDDLTARGLDTLSTVFDQAATLELPGLALRGAMQDFDLDRSLRMARLTSVAYCSDKDIVLAWNCTRCGRVTQFLQHEVVFDQVWDLLGYAGYDQALDAVVVAFRGTDSHSWGNWINNLKTWHMNKMYPVDGASNAMVHAGFYDLWTKSALQENLTRAVGEVLDAHPTPRLFITGHSMGAALASLAALDLKFRHNFTEVRTWTFGSPRVGNSAWQALFQQHVVESWRFTHNRDVVPSLPPMLLGYHHLAREAWTVDYAAPGGVVEQKILICDDSGEDPSCHNSACLLGLCTSVADHLLYLGVEMYRDGEEC